VIGIRRGTFIVAVLTDDGLLVAADSRYSLLAPGAGTQRQRKIRPVPRPPRSVLCVAGVDRIVRVPGVTRAGWTPGPSDVLIDYAEIAIARLPETVEGLTLEWAARTGFECARRLEEDPRIQWPPASASPERPITQIVLASARESGRSGRLTVAGLWLGPPWGEPARITADVHDLTRVGDAHFFGDLPFLEQNLPEDFARCRALLSSVRLSADTASSAAAALVEAAGAMPGSTIGSPTDAVLIASGVVSCNPSASGT
jgi:hypothetical protein